VASWSDDAIIVVVRGRPFGDGGLPRATIWIRLYAAARGLVLDTVERIDVGAAASVLVTDPGGCIGFEAGGPGWRRWDGRLAGCEGGGEVCVEARLLGRVELDERVDDGVLRLSC
jgi:hypothetical protein